MNYKKENSRLMYKETLKAMYRLFDKPVKRPRTTKEIMNIEGICITRHSIIKLVDNNILIKSSRTEYKLAKPRKKVWQIMERL